MKNFNLIKPLWLTLFAGVLLLNSCSDDKMDDGPKFDYDYIIEFTSSSPVVNKNTIFYEWVAIGERARTYTVEISRYEDFQISELFYVEDNSILIEDLRYESKYYTRVRGNLKNGKITVWTEASPVITPAEQLDMSVTTDFTEVVVAENTIRYVWEIVEDAETYTIQISETSDFWDYISASTTANAYPFNRELDYNTTYYARVRAELENGLPTQWAYSGPYTTEVRKPDLIYNMEVEGNSVKLYLTEDEEFEMTEIRIAKSSGSIDNPDITIELTEEIISSGIITIEDLVPVLSYNVALYGVYEDEEILINSLNFTTDFVYLRDFYVDEEQYLGELLNLMTSDMGAITFYLPRGYSKNVTYLSEPVNIIGTNINITSLDEDNRASVNINSVMSLKSGLNSITFSKVDFTSSDKNFLFEFSEEGVNKLEIDDCKFTDFPNGLVTGARNYPAEIILKNSLLIWTNASSPNNAGYALFRNSNTTNADYDFSIKVTNCTLVNMPVSFLQGGDSSNGSYYTLDIANCTFVGLDRVPKQWFRYRKRASTFHNNIIVKLPGYENNPYDMRYFTVWPDGGTNNFASGDMFKASNYHFGNAARDNTKQLPESGDVIMPGILNGNYTISDDIIYDGQQLSRMGIGDKRWFPAGVAEADY